MKFSKGAKRWTALALGTALILGSSFPWYPVRVQAETVDLSEGLVGHWTFDDGTDAGKNLAEGVGNAEVVGSGIAVSGEGVLGKSVSFDGSYSYLKVPECINTKKEAVSFAFWAKVDETAFGLARNMTLLQQSGSGRTFLYLNPSRYPGTYLAGADQVASQSMESGKWYHMAAVSDPGARTYTFYLNGKKLNTEQVSDNYVDALTDLYIGAHKNRNDANPMKGLLDELRFYKKALTETEVKSIFDLEKQGLGWEDPDETKPVQITVNPAQTKKILSPAMFGINHRYHLNGVSSWNPQTNEPYEEFDRIARQSSFGSVRYPGGAVANLFEWKRSIGPRQERINTIHGAANYSQTEPIEPNFGLDEAAEYICDDLNSEMVYVYGMGRGSAEDAADLVEYLNAPNDGSNPGGGTDWAAVRAQNGHEEPYGVTYFELGNEMDIWGQDYWLSGRPSGTSLTGAYLNGGDMSFRDQKVVEESDWRDPAGKGNGQPGQVKYTKYFPVDTATVELKVGGETWTQTDSLEERGKEKVYTIDGETGKIQFGDGTHGMIPPAGAAMTVSYTSHQDGYREYLSAMKAVDPDIRLYSCLSTDEFINSDAEYDGVVVHPYAAPSSSENFYEESLNLVMTSAIANVSRVQKKIRSAKGEDTQADIAVSEFGIFRSTNELLKTQTNAMNSALEILKMVELDVEYSNRHCLIDYPDGDVLGPGQQAVIQAIERKDGSGTYDYVSTPSARLYELLAGMSASTVVEDEVKNNPVFYADLNAVHTLSTKDEDAVYVIALNLYRDQEKEAVLEIAGQDLTNRKIEVWTLDGDSYDARNTIEDPDRVAVKKGLMAGSGTTLSCTLPPHSVTGFKITGEEITYRDLTSRIQEAEGYSQSDYTQESFGVLTRALEAARALEEGAAPQEIAKKIQELEEAIRGLVKKEEPEPPEEYRDFVQTEYWEKEKSLGTLGEQTEEDVWHYQFLKNGVWEDIPEEGYSARYDAWLHRTDESSADSDYFWARIGKNQLVPLFQAGDKEHRGVAYAWKAGKTGYVKTGLAKNLRVNASLEKDPITFSITRGTKSEDIRILTEKILPAGSQDIQREEFAKVVKIEKGDYLRFSVSYANNDVFDVEPLVEEADVREYALWYYGEVKDLASTGTYTQESVKAFEDALAALKEAMDAPQAVEAVVEGAIRDVEEAAGKLTEWVKVTGITLNTESVTLKEKGETFLLKGNIVPENATNQQIHWSSSNPAAAEVTKSGEIKAVSEGTAVIRAESTESGEIYAECTVRVEIAEPDTEPEQPDPEKPDPENPKPENPKPENPKPENPKPEKQKTVSKKAVLKWKKTGGASKYRIYMKTGKGRYRKLATVKGKKSTYIRTGLKSNGKYRFKVIASNGKKVRVKTSFRRTIRMTWKNVSGYEGYEIYVKEGKAPYRKKKTVKKGGTISYTVKNARTGKSYRFRLKGYTTSGGKKEYKTLS